MWPLVRVLLAGVTAWAQAIPVADLEMQKLDATVVNYLGKEATRMVAADTNRIALLKKSVFQNGTIEVDLAGKPAAGSAAAARGFIGIAFRVQGGGSKYEVIYLRPTNGRADDMLRRNHSTQYVSDPEWPWERLRKESPGVYESYVDLEAGIWTRYRMFRIPEQSFM